MFRAVGASITFALVTVLSFGSSWAAFVSADVDAYLLGYSPNGLGNTANVYGAGFDGTTPAGANWSPGAPPIIMPPPANQGGVYQSPFNNTPIAGSQSFFAVGPQTSPVTLGWGGDDQTSFTMLWGSIDSYNLIEFLHESGNPANDTTLTGAGLVALFPGELTGTGPNYEQVALLQFVFNDGAPGSDIDAIRFSSSQAAFEFGLQAIPVPASLMLFLSALAGLCALTLRRGG